MEMKLNSLTTVHNKPRRVYPSTAVQPSPSLDQIRVAYLTSRHGLPSARAVLVAGIYFGEVRS
jgi:hypothetical protein